MCELLPNKKIGIAIPFHHLLFSEITIHFPNVMAILQTKRDLNIFSNIIDYLRVGKEGEKKKEEEYCSWLILRVYTSRSA